MTNLLLNGNYSGLNPFQQMSKTSTSQTMPATVLSNVSAYDRVTFGQASISQDAYKTLFDSNTTITPQEVEKILTSIDNNDVEALKLLPSKTLNKRGKGFYPFTSYALEKRKWAVASYLIKHQEMPNTSYVFLENLRVNQEPDLSKRSTLILEAIYRKAPLFIIEEILRHDGIELNNHVKINGQNAYDWVKNGVEKSKNFFGFEKFHPYYKSLQGLLDQYLHDQNSKLEFDRYMDPLLLH